MSEKIEKIKELRKMTNLSIIECKKALEESGYDLEKAKKLLQLKVGEFSKGKEKRETKEGIVASYVHTTKKIGVLLELLCETDFVAKSPLFEKLAHEICLQIAAQNPLYLKEKDIPKALLKEKKENFKILFENKIKDKKELEKEIQKKIEEYKKEICLLEQKWIKDESKTIDNLIKDHIAKFGENIKIGRFVRYQI